MASAATTATQWQLSGDYFENCNCDIVCPCLFSALPQLTAQPTSGACEVAIGFHVEQGRYGDVSLDGLNTAVMSRTPGAMGVGNWSVALHSDQRASEQQRRILVGCVAGAV